MNVHISLKPTSGGIRKNMYYTSDQNITTQLELTWNIFNAYVLFTIDSHMSHAYFP